MSQINKYSENSVLSPNQQQSALSLLNKSMICLCNILGICLHQWTTSFYKRFMKLL